MIPRRCIARLRGAALGALRARTRGVACSPPASSAPRPPRCTEEGVLIHEASPYRDSLHLVWGSVLWDAGLALAKYFAWSEGQAAGGPGALRSASVLELGAGTGVVGLTLGKLGARVTLTDCEPELLELLRRNAAANGLGAEVEVRELNWVDRSTFLRSPHFDFVVAADVLYSKKDRMFVRALEAHMSGSRRTTAFVACPPRADSPLAGFFEMLARLGLRVERLEDAQGCAVASTSGQAASVYKGSRFAELSEDRCLVAAQDAKERIQIFRLTWP